MGLGGPSTYCVSLLCHFQCKSCGSGHRRREVLCLDEKQEEVHEMYCVDQRRNVDSEICNTDACEFIWIKGEWTEVRSLSISAIDVCVQLFMCYFKYVKRQVDL